MDINQLSELFKLSNMMKQRNQELREMFKKFIKPNLLIRVMEEIREMPEFIDIVVKYNCYPLQLKAILALGSEDMDFDICFNLAMINWYLLLSVKDEDKHEYYHNNNYIQDIKLRTIEQCRLRQLIQNVEERNFALVHAPINYSIHCMVNFLLTHVNDNLRKKNRTSVPNANYKINSLIVMLKNIRSILLLTESDNCGSAFSLLRALIESMFVYFTIYDNETVANEYYKFMEYRIAYEEGGQYPQNFIDILPKNVQTQNYLNYGWLDSIQKKERKYTFTEVVEYCRIANKNYKDSYLTAYKYCCKFAHGNYIKQIINPYSFIWILEKTGRILLYLAEEFSFIFQEKVVFNDVDLETYLTESVNEAIEVFNKINTETENSA